MGIVLLNLKFEILFAGLAYNTTSLRWHRCTFSQTCSPSVQYREQNHKYAWTKTFTALISHEFLVIDLAVPSAVQLFIHFFTTKFRECKIDTQYQWRCTFKLCCKGWHTVIDVNQFCCPKVFCRLYHAHATTNRTLLFSSSSNVGRYVRLFSLPTKGTTMSFFLFF